MSIIIPDHHPFVSIAVPCLYHPNDLRWESTAPEVQSCPFHIR
jgi:hypothetical protein